MRRTGETLMLWSCVRRAALAGLVVLAAGVLVTGALAAAPERIPPVPAEDATIENSCPFPVVLHIVVNNAVTTVFADGHVLVTGAIKATLTNATDPTKSINVNVPGPGTLTTTDDGKTLLTAVGSWLFIFEPDQLGPGTPGSLLLTTGRATLLFNPDGTQVFTHTGGTTTDVCALLA